LNISGTGAASDAAPHFGQNDALQGNGHIETLQRKLWTR
jgi:hypothetical protein